MANTKFNSLLMFVCILCTQMTKGVDGQCATPPINLVVYEGTKNTSMMCGSPTKVSWNIKPASDNLGTYTITRYDDVVATAYTNLYGVNSSSLLIKTGQGLATVPPISTAGLYISLINGSTTKYGAKLTVVRQPPACNCTAVNSTKMSITCSLSYADSTYHPINPYMNWTSDGNFYRNDTPVPKNVGGYWVSTSVIVVDIYDTANYQCNVAFGIPTNVQFAYIATNAPAFSASCTPPFCGVTTSAPPTSTTQPPTIQPPTTQPPASQPLATDLPSATPSTDCSCTQNKACSSPDRKCTEDKECLSDETNLTDIYSECVVKAELYARCDSCCPETLVCGVVVTLRNDSRWLIYDPQCDDNKCEMVVVSASCMSSDWKLLAERNIVKSGVGDYAQAGNIVYNVTDCSESCKRLMNLP